MEIKPKKKREVVSKTAAKRCTYKHHFKTVTHTRNGYYLSNAEWIPKEDIVYICMIKMVFKISGGKNIHHITLQVT